MKFIKGINDFLDSLINLRTDSEFLNLNLNANDIALKIIAKIFIVFYCILIIFYTILVNFYYTNNIDSILLSLIFLIPITFANIYAFFKCKEVKNNKLSDFIMCWTLLYIAMFFQGFLWLIFSTLCAILILVLIPLAPIFFLINYILILFKRHKLKLFYACLSIIILALLLFIYNQPIELRSFTENGLCGYKNIFDKIIIESQYDTCNGFYNGSALVEQYTDDAYKFEVELENILNKQNPKKITPYVTKKKYCINKFNEKVNKSACK